VVLEQANRKVGVSRELQGTRIRVLSLQSGADIGGTELMTWSILRRLDRNIFDIEICFLDEEGPVTEMYRQEGMTVRHLRYHERPLFRVVCDLGWVLKWGNYEIVHMYGLRANLLGRLLGRWARVPGVVAAQHSVDSWRKWWHVWLDRLTSGMVSVYISNSFAGAQRLQTVERVPKEKILVIHNGIDTDYLAIARRGKIRRELGVPADVKVFVCVANLREAKGHDTLLKAASRLDEVNAAWCLWFVGDGPLRSKLEEQAERLGIQRQVYFLGRRNDVGDILADADIFVLASRWEGLPGAVMEAMAAGLPVVATRVGGLPEVVVDGETGILVTPEDSRALADAMKTLAVSSSLAREFGVAGRRRLETRFTLDDKVREQERVYLALYGR